MENTKLKGDVAEQSFALHSLEKGWGVSIPVSYGSTIYLIETTKRQRLPKAAKY